MYSFPYPGIVLIDVAVRLLQVSGIPYCPELQPNLRAKNNPLGTLLQDENASSARSSDVRSRQVRISICKSIILVNLGYNCKMSNKLIQVQLCFEKSNQMIDTSIICNHPVDKEKSLNVKGPVK